MKTHHKTLAEAKKHAQEASKNSDFKVYVFSVFGGYEVSEGQLTGTQVAAFHKGEEVDKDD